MAARSMVVSIHLAPAGGAPVISVGQVLAVAGKGLEGDRYFTGSGTYSSQPGSGRQVTLIEAEAIEALRRDYDLELDAARARRNIVTRGVALNHLVGAEFSVGEAVLRGARLCEPCAHMEKLSVKGALRGLIHRGGLRAEILRSGMIRVGDPIVRIESASGKGADR
ncbi:MAG TPA: MOSC domain-containing protein [candidate division Zixibacteria bacterium]|nr:MOSC domain-containing protein [candidate division Zixibacteria bacterium]